MIASRIVVHLLVSASEGSVLTAAGLIGTTGVGGCSTIAVFSAAEEAVADVIVPGTPVVGYYVCWDLWAETSNGLEI